MKKTIVKLIGLVLSILILLTCFSCSDPVTLNIRLNHSEADYTEEYRQANGNFTSKNLSKIVGNKKITDLPTGEDLIAPSGKIFAGWYFDEEGTSDKIYNQTNWDIHFSEKNGASVYAKWINSDEALFIFDVTNGGDFTLDFKNDNGFVGKIYQKTINISQLESDLSCFPCASDLVAPKNKVFAGWYLDANFNNPLNANTILNSLNTRTNGNYTLYPKFEDLPTIRIIYHWDGFTMIDGIAEEYYDNSGFYNVSLTVLDNGNTYSLAENSLPKEEYFNLFNYVFDGWYLDSEFTIEFNEVNYNLQVANAKEDAIFQSIDVNVFLKSHWQE